MTDFAPKYRFAVAATGEMVDILTLSREDRALLKPFTCLSCGAPMSGRLPRAKVAHFAHTAKPTCARETYLHRLAKHVFLTTYRECVRTGRPYRLRRRVISRCTHFRTELGIECERAGPAEHDLTRYFPLADAEREVRVGLGALRADVLLHHPERDDVVLVEFAVTHPCTEEKRASGLRILEVPVESEADAVRLGRAELDASRGEAECINFTDRPKRGPLCGGDCHEEVWVFLVYPSGKSVLTAESPRRVVHDLLRRRVEHREVLGIGEIDPIMTFRQKVREAHFAGVPLRNCFLCAYHGGDGLENAVFCKRYRQSVGSNQAVDCDAYRPLPSMEACEEADRKNEAYLREHSPRLMARALTRKLFGGW